MSENRNPIVCGPTRPHAMNESERTLCATDRDGLDRDRKEVEYGKADSGKGTSSFTSP